MPKFEVSWQVFGTAVIEAEDANAAEDGLYEYIDQELTIDYDGVDAEWVSSAADWQDVDFTFESED